MRTLIGFLFVFLSIALTLPVQGREFTDSAGRTVVVPERINKVLTAGPPASILIYTLAPQKLAGWVRSPSEKEKPFLLPEVRELPVLGRLTGKGGDANLETVLAAHPDIIIDVGTINETYKSLADRVQEQTGIPYILVDGRFDRTAETFRRLGELLGVEERAALLAAYTEKVQEDLDVGLQRIARDHRPRVYYGRGPKGLETGLGGSINMEILDVVGANNVAAELGQGGLTTVSPEQVLAWNPEIILASTPTFVETVKTDERWKSIQAVENGKVYFTPVLPFGWFDAPPGVNRLVGVRWLQHLLYPEIFSNDLHHDVREFYELFYQVNINETQLDELLSQAVPRRK